jgi:hypothetical protein
MLLSKFLSSSSDSAGIAGSNSDDELSKEFVFWFMPATRRRACSDSAVGISGSEFWF